MKFSLRLILLLTLLPGIAYALGLGNLDPDSALNEPFSGKIKLLSAGPDELDSLTVSLADADAFDRANIDRPFILSELIFKLVRSETGDDYIQVSSEDPIREPFLNFLVEVNWANGRLYREYTVLLDPPMYDAEVSTAEIMALAPSEPAPAALPDDPDHQVVYADDFDQYSSGVSAPVTSAPAPVARSVDYSGGEFGPTGANDTLWSIATAMRPDSSVSINQMMLALLKANPDAFANDNVNGLKRGQILQMPSEAEIAALSKAEALTETKKQYAAWEQIKGATAADVSERPETSSGAVTEPADEVVEETAETDDAELKLLSADDAEEATEQVAEVEGSSTASDLILAEESIQALTQENIELKDQLQETEALLADLKRLLELKDDELAVLQQQLAEEGAEEIAAETDAADDAEEVIEETVEETLVADDSEVTEPVEEEMAADETAAEEEIEVLQIEPESAAAGGGVMDMLSPYLGPVTDLVGGNPLYAIAAVGLLVVLILIAVASKLKKKKEAEPSDADVTTAEAFPDFDEEVSDIDEAQQVLDSEEETVLPGNEEPDTEDETIIAGTEEDDNSEDETYLPDRSEEEAEPEPAAAVAEPEAEEEDEDPLQEVNTYLAFEQFDQAEEFVRSAIQDKPDNPEFHTKLLEVFYTSGNKKSYEEEAKVLHELVNGEGEHWDMAVAMWSEMSPNRELFGEGEVEDDESVDSAGGGFVDVTADAEAGDNENTLDFDIGGDEAPAAEADDEMLDVTAADDGEDILDVTAVDEGEDVLDVTAAASLDIDEEDLAFSEEATMDSSLDEGGEDLLDVTAVGSKDELDDDVLDVSSSGIGSEDKLESTSAEEAGGDTLEMSSTSGLEMDSGEDMLDLTAASSASADSDELLDLDLDTGSDEDAAEGDDNVIDFDAAAGVDDDTLSLDIEESTAGDDLEGGLELDLGDADDAADDEDAIADTIADDGLELSLTGEDLGSEDSDEPIRLDVDIDTDDADEVPSLDLDIDADDSASAESDDANTLDFDLALDEDSGSEADDAVSDGTGTLEMEPPELEMDDDDDDDEDSTVFVPRASQPEEQSAEDEIATKLDLAKAYVELGDKDSAKTILDEVMAAGNDEQKQQAQDLLGQV